MESKDSILLFWNDCLILSPMSRDELLKHRWNTIVTLLSNRFADGETLDLDGIILQLDSRNWGNCIENSKGRENQLDAYCHFADCWFHLGNYEFEYFDDDGWPHYKNLNNYLPKGREQTRIDEGSHCFVF